MAREEQVTIDIVTASEPDPQAELPGSPSSPTNADALNPYAEHMRDYAPVWPKYLKVAKDFDDALVKNWKSDCDTLLIFTGLLTAALTSFLDDIRKGLDSKSQYLTSVNQVWLMAFVFSLMSALGAILAKGWIAHYSTVSPGTSGLHARQRQHRYNLASSWIFRFINSSFPVSLRLALYLFFSGLALRIGTARGSFIVYFVYFLGFLIYTVIYPIILRRFMRKPTSDRGGMIYLPTGPSSEYPPQVWELTLYLMCFLFLALFNAFKWLAYTLIHLTPLGKHTPAFAPTLPARLRSGPSIWTDPTEHELTADALAWLLAATADASVLHAAARAAAGMPRSAYFARALWAHGADGVLAHGFARVVRGGPPANAAEELAGAYLHALWHLFAEDRAQARDSVVLDSLVARSGALYRWETMPPPLRPVAFAVQTFIKFRGRHCPGGADGYGEKGTAAVAACVQAARVMLEEAGTALRAHERHAVGTALALRMRYGSETEWARSVVFAAALCEHHRAVPARQQSRGEDASMPAALALCGVGARIMRGLMKGWGRHVDGAWAGVAALLQYRELTAELAHSENLSLLLELTAALHDKTSRAPGAPAEAFALLTQHADIRLALATSDVLEPLFNALTNKDVRGLAFPAIAALAQYGELRSVLAKSGLYREFLEAFKEAILIDREGSIETFSAVIKQDKVRATIAEPGLLQSLLDASGDTQIWLPAEGLRLFLQYDDTRAAIANPDFLHRMVTVLLRQLETCDASIRGSIMDSLHILLEHDDTRAALESSDLWEKICIASKGPSADSRSGVFHV